MRSKAIGLPSPKSVFNKKKYVIDVDVQQAEVTRKLVAELRTQSAQKRQVQV